MRSAILNQMSRMISLLFAGIASRYIACAHYQGNGRNGSIMYALIVNLLSDRIAEIKVNGKLAGYLVKDFDGNYQCLDGDGMNITPGNGPYADYQVSLFRVITVHL